MLYRNFTIISLFMLGTALLGVSVMNENYRTKTYHMVFSSKAPVRSIVLLDVAPASNAALPANLPSQGTSSGD